MLDVAGEREGKGRMWLSEAKGHGALRMGMCGAAVSHLQQTGPRVFHMS